MKMYARADRAAGALRRWIACERGAYAVEFALISPVLLVMLLGTVQFGMGFYEGSTVQYCVERAARTGMLDGTLTEGQLQAKVDETLAAHGSDLDVTVHYTVDNSGPVPIAEVTTSYPYEIRIPFFTVYHLNFSVDTFIPQPAG